jgi:hypothetical protein
MANLREIIREAAASGDQPYAKVCRVTSVGEGVVDLEPVDGSAPIYDAPLLPGGEGDGLLLTPKQDSYVTVVFTGKHTAMAVGVGELSSVRYKEGELLVDLDGTTGKVSIANGATSLRQLLLDLKGIIEQLKVATPSGPSTGLLPDSTAQLALFETNLNALLS